MPKIQRTNETISENGYIHLVNIPSEKELSDFYENKYYGLIKTGSKAPEIRRLMSTERESEHNWLCKTLYSDIHNVLSLNSCNKILEVGCGTGDLLYYLKERNMEVVGIEPSKDASSIAITKKLNVYNTSFEAFTNTYPGLFDVVLFLSVLEHVPNPIHVLNLAKQTLKPNGIVCIRVPNDFNELQKFAKDKLECPEWWISRPDHINYFNFGSLSNILYSLGFEVIYSQGDFPMELFLLMGDNYINNPEIGNICHEKRKSFEFSISDELRRKLYSTLATIGIGRDCMIFGRLK